MASSDGVTLGFDVQISMVRTNDDQSYLEVGAMGNYVENLEIGNHCICCTYSVVSDLYDASVTKFM